MGSKEWVACNNTTPVRQAFRRYIIPLEIKSHLIYFTCNECSGLTYSIIYLLHVTSGHGILLPKKFLCKQVWKCTYNLALWRFRVTVVAVRKEPWIVCFSTLSHSRRDFRKQLLSIKCVFWFSLQLLAEVFLILRRVQWFVIINASWSACKVPVILVRFNPT